MRKKAKTRDLFSKLDEESKRKPSRASKSSDKAKPARAGRSNGEDYTAHDIEVLEGLEPVRRRPGMYIGGTDEKAMHHLFAEVLDNAMDEAVAGHASRIEVSLEADGFLTVTDNGRGFDTASTEGQGLRSMARRASGVGGSLQVTSHSGWGTRVTFAVPVR